MTMGERIRFFRKRNRLRACDLGRLLGFGESSAGTRISQYECALRIPRPELVRSMAEIFHVSPQAIAIPDMDSETDLMHFLFALEDTYGLKIGWNGLDIVLYLDDSMSKTNSLLHISLIQWMIESEKLKKGMITSEEYDEWRYNYSGRTVSLDPDLYSEEIRRLNIVQPAVCLPSWMCSLDGIKKHAASFYPAGSEANI